jgi:DNA-directed RNA polymerase subunit RPC12/RpoP
MVVYFVFAFVFACCSWTVARQKNRNDFIWFAFTLLCPLLFILLVCLPKIEDDIPGLPREKHVAIPEQSTPQKQVRECPYCAEDILVKAKVCKHCGRDVEPREIDITR